MKKIILIINTLLLFAAIATAQNNRAVQVSDIEFIHSDEYISIEFTLKAGEKATKSNYNLIITPTIQNGGYKKQLSAIVIQGRRAQIADSRYELANGQRIYEQEPDYMKPGESLKYKSVIPYESWMRGGDLVFNGLSVDCCSSKETTSGLIASNILDAKPTFDFQVVEEPILVPRSSTREYIASNTGYDTSRQGNVSSVGRDNNHYGTQAGQQGQVGQQGQTAGQHGQTAGTANDRRTGAAGTTGSSNNNYYGTQAGQQGQVGQQGQTAGQHDDYRMNANASTGERLSVRYPFIEPVSSFESVGQTSDRDLFDYNMPLNLGKGLTASNQNKIDNFLNQAREGSISVYFRQGKYDIDRFYLDNNTNLVELVSVVRTLSTSNDSRIIRIVIAGFASPEGSLALNDRLAWDRAVAVKSFLVANSDVDPKIINIYNGSVDWIGLREMVADSDMFRKHSIIDIIDNTPIWDATRKVGRHGELMRLDDGSQYRFMLREFFPRLRQAAYIKVYFENKF